MIQTAFEKLGFKTCSYTGRGMREECFGVILPYGTSIVSVGAKLSMAVMHMCKNTLTVLGLIDEIEKLSTYLDNSRVDNIGKDLIIYFPRIKYQEEKNKLH